MDLIWFDLSFHVKTPTAFSLFFATEIATLDEFHNSWKFGLLALATECPLHRVARPLFTIIGF